MNPQNHAKFTYRERERRGEEKGGRRAGRRGGEEILGPRQAELGNNSYRNKIHTET